MEKYIRGDAKRCKNGFRYKDPWCNPKEVKVVDESYIWPGPGSRCRNGFRHKKNLCVRSKKRRKFIVEDDIVQPASVQKLPDFSLAEQVKTISKNPFVDMSPGAFQGKKKKRTPTPEQLDFFGYPLGFDKSVKNRTPTSVKYPVKTKNRTPTPEQFDWFGNPMGFDKSVKNRTKRRTETERAYDYSPTEKKKTKSETPKRNALARWWNPTPKKNTVRKKRKKKTPKRGWFGQELPPTPIVTHRKTETPQFMY